MTTPRLFEPLTVGRLTLANRIWTSPMCQYSVEARDGVPADWHLVQYGGFANGGFGLVLAEASGVVPEGRISPYDTGIWNDEQADAWRRIVDFAHARGAAMGLQLGHAGRKGSTERPFPGRASRTVPAREGGWRPVGPTDAPGDGPAFTRPPHALDPDQIEGVVEAFAAAARRADAAGFDVVEVHGAHGYLLHQFYSPLSNTRTDEWGGDFVGRTRLIRAVTRAVRDAFDPAKPVFVRLSATDWVEGGWAIEDSVRLATLLASDGADLIDVSSGGNVRADIPLDPGYQVAFSERIRREGGVRTAAVGLITSPRQAEQVLERGEADAILLARAALRDPNWPLHAAHELGVPPENAGWQPARWRGAVPLGEAWM